MNDNSRPVCLAIHGASGRMGIEILRAARSRKDCVITAALVRAASDWNDEPLSRVLGSDGPDIDFIAHLDPEVLVDVIVDFSTPDALETALSIAQLRKIAFVCGTTGLTEGQLARLKLASEHIPVLWSSNFSLGVALLKRMDPDSTKWIDPKQGSRRIVPHGFRASFRTWASECTAYDHETKEMALAHTIEDKTEEAYRRGDLFDKRLPLMRDWGRYCEGGAPAKRKAAA